MSILFSSSGLQKGHAMKSSFIRSFKAILFSLLLPSLALGMRKTPFESLMNHLKEKKFDAANTLLRGTDVNPNEQDAVGNTPLHYAVKGKAMEVVRTLLAKGANSAIKNKEGQSPLKLAIIQNNSSLVSLLLDGINKDVNKISSALYVPEAQVSPQETKEEAQALSSDLEKQLRLSKKHLKPMKPQAEELTAQQIEKRAQWQKAVVSNVDSLKQDLEELKKEYIKESFANKGKKITSKLQQIDSDIKYLEKLIPHASEEEWAD